MPDRKPAEPPLGAVLGPGTRHEGDLSFEGRVRVDGTFVGRLYSEDTLEVGESGRVEGEIDVARAVISGVVEGRLRVREHLSVRRTAVLRGLVDAGVAEIEAGAAIAGEVRVAGREIS